MTTRTPFAPTSLAPVSSVDAAIAAYLAGDLAGVQNAYAHVTAVLDDLLAGTPVPCGEGAPLPCDSDTIVDATVTGVL